MASNGPTRIDPYDEASQFVNACEQLVKSYSRTEALAVARALDAAAREQGFLRPEALLQLQLIRRLHGL